MKKFWMLVLLVATPLVCAAGPGLVDMDIPTGTEAGVVQNLSLVKGRIMISGQQLDLSPKASQSLLKEREFYGDLVGKIVVFEVAKDRKGTFVKDIFVQEKRR